MRAGEKGYHVVRNEGEFLNDDGRNTKLRN